MTTEMELVFPDREIEVIKLIAANKSFPEIGEAMGLSPRTARSYAESARKKLRVKFARDLPRAYQEATGENPWPA